MNVINLIFSNNIEIKNGIQILQLLFPIGSFLLLSKESPETKDYQKRFIILLYLILLISFLIFDNYLKSNVVILAILVFLVTLQMIYDSDELEKELSGLQIYIYELTKFFFLIKGYIFLLCFSILCAVDYFLVLIQNTNKVHSIWIHIVIIILFFTVHFIQNGRDRFNIKSFLEVKNFLGFNNEINPKNEIILEEISYFEDKDFFENSAFTINIPLIVKRKIRNQKVSVRNLNRNVYDRISRYLRGYSTIEMQLIRNTAMLPNTYHYTVRRKLFVELIYTKYFFKALYMQQLKFSGISLKEFKMKILEIYLIKIHGCDSNITHEKLYELLSNESKHSFEYYSNNCNNISIDE